MNLKNRWLTSVGLLGLILAFSCFAVNAQEKETAQILKGTGLTNIVPTGFYFEGQSAPTQMRNSAAVSFGKKRNVIIGLVDTSGYSSEISGKYEGFLITDSPIQIGGKDLNTGAYGFGFTSDNKLNIFDIGGRQILSVATANDKSMTRPRPIMITATDETRFYKGRNYVLIGIQAN
ncbi:MAG: hypothetical protein ABI954_06915 [Pyrinomonadaceae bacterium]